MSWRILRSIKFSVIPFLTLCAFTTTVYNCSTGYSYLLYNYNDKCSKSNEILHEFLALSIARGLLIIALPIY